MHIGVIPCSDPSHGGSYQYSLGLLQCIRTLSANFTKDEFTLFVQSGRQAQHFDTVWSRSRQMFPLLSKERFCDALEGRIRSAWLRQHTKRIALCLLPHKFRNPERISKNRVMHSFLTQQRIDWALYTTPTILSFES